MDATEQLEAEGNEHAKQNTGHQKRKRQAMCSRLAWPESSQAPCKRALSKIALRLSKAPHSNSPSK